MAGSQMNLRVDTLDRGRWDLVAAEQNMSFSGFVREALDLVSGFSLWFRQRVKEAAQRCEVSPAHLIESLCIEVMADEAADREVRGFIPHRIGYLDFEVGPNDCGQTQSQGERLYEKLKAEKVEQKKLELEQQKSDDETLKAALGLLLQAKNSGENNS